VADLIDEATYYLIVLRMCCRMPCEVLVGVTWRVVRVRRVPVYARVCVSCVPVCARARVREKPRRTPREAYGLAWVRGCYGASRRISQSLSGSYQLL
jgi:hypothetical protein